MTTVNGYAPVNGDQANATVQQPVYFGVPVAPQDAAQQPENATVQTPYGYAQNVQAQPVQQPVYAGQPNVAADTTTVQQPVYAGQPNVAVQPQPTYAGMPIATEKTDSADV